MERACKLAAISSQFIRTLSCSCEVGDSLPSCFCQALVQSMLAMFLGCCGQDTSIVKTLELAPW